MHGLHPIALPVLLARRQNYRAVMASSYDRRGGNHDWSNYLRLEGRQAVLMEAEGPGCITRIWTADPQKGTVRIILDGKCVVEKPFADLLADLPLTYGIGGESPANYARSKADHVPMGFTSYCPIPFRSHCKVTIEPEDDYLYYQIGAKLLAPETAPDEFNLASADILQVEKVLRDWSEGKPLVDMSQTPIRPATVEPDSEQTIFESEGPGAVLALRISLPAGPSDRERRHIRENLWLVGHFDDDEPRDASIRAPIGAMFLDYGQTPRPRSLFVGSDREGDYYCFFAMPFAHRAHLKLVNHGLLPADFVVRVLAEEWEAPKHDLLRFRATWHTETPFGPDHRDYEGLACRLLNLGGQENIELLYVHGAGHFVGCGFSYDLANSPTDRAAGEGDEMFFIDDDPRLTHYGTGLEDYTNDAWGMSGFSSPFAGDAKGDGGNSDAHLFGYRLHVADPIPFVRKGRFTFEHGTGNNCSGDFRSVAYWYMDPSHSRTRIEERRWEAIRTGQRKMNEEE